MKTTNPLSAEQMSFFDTFGFLSFPNLLSDRVDRIIEEFEAIWAANGGGHNGKLHDGEKRSAILPFPDRSEYLSSLLDDPRIHDIASSICGEDFNYYGGDGNFYSGDTNWHSDGYATRPVISIKIAFYLDKLTSTTGALRVIPGSHKIGDKFGLSLEEYVKDTETTLGMDPSEVPSQVLEITPGDIVVFNHSIKHASFGGSSRRRMFTMNFSERYPDDKIDDLREQLGSESRFWIDRIHGEEMIRTASPERWVHLEQVRANDTHLAELTMKKKKTMEEPSRG